MDLQCAQCKLTFPPKREGQIYCSRSCASKARMPRTLPLARCEYLPCGKEFRPRGATRMHFCCIEHAMAHRRRPPVHCAWHDCPCPDELIAGSDHRDYHPECLKAFYRSGADKPRRILRRATCLACGGEILYRANGGRERKYHSACYRLLANRPHGGPPRTGAFRSCEMCGTSVYHTASRARHAAHAFCSRQHYLAWQIEQTSQTRCRIRCTLCGDERVLATSKLPRTIDPDTMTWTCSACRRRQGQMHTAVCPHCNEQFTKRIKDFASHKQYFCCRDHKNEWHRNNPKERAMVTVSCPYCWQEATAGRMSFNDAKFPLLRSRLPYAKKHFHNKSHRARYYNRKRWAVTPCRTCHIPFQPRGAQNIYCSRSCADKGRSGQPIANPRLTRAESAVMDAWDNGSHEIKAIVRITGVSRNTIRKIIRSRNLQDGPAFTYASIAS